MERICLRKKREKNTKKEKEEKLEWLISLPDIILTVIKKFFS